MNNIGKSAWKEELFNKSAGKYFAPLIFAARFLENGLQNIRLVIFEKNARV
jgi:hypothetical protein